MPVDLEGHLTEGSSVHRRALTPVIQTSHNSWLHYFSDSKDLASPLTGAGTKPKQAVKRRLQRGEHVAERLLRWEWLREMFLLSFAIS